MSKQEIMFETSRNLFDFKVKVGATTKFEVKSKYQVYVFVADNQSIYMEIHAKNKDDEYAVVFDIVRKISIEDELFVITKEDSDYVEIDYSFFADEDIVELKTIHSTLTRKMKDYLVELRELSGLTVKGVKESKYVWLNIQDGFSNTWKEGDLGFKTLDDFLFSLAEDNELKDKGSWKLIEYVCHTDKDFEFNQHMKLR